MLAAAVFVKRGICANICINGFSEIRGVDFFRHSFCVRITLRFAAPYINAHCLALIKEGF